MARDDEDFSAFIVARYGTLVRSAVLLGCSRQEAEDAVQDALLRCYRSWARVKRAQDPDAYVYRVLVNGIFGGWRRRWRHEIPVGELPEPAAGEDIARDVLMRHGVRTGLLSLGVQHRQVLVLRYFVDLTEAQVAEVLGIPRGTVKSRASRAIAQLAQDSSLAELVTTQEEQP
jgi:RNA polymerase sigma-70 factor (sigma-E family)